MSVRIGHPPRRGVKVLKVGAVVLPSGHAFALTPRMVAKYNKLLLVVISIKANL